MPRRLAQLELNNFTKGLITEAGPLTFPDNASLDEDNFVLKKDGSRHRRLGMDYEDSYSILTSSASTTSTGKVALNSFNWRNAGQSASNDLIVVQIGSYLSFFKNTTGFVSSERITVTGGVTTYEFDLGSDKTKVASMAVVDGILVVASGESDISIFEYDGVNVTKDTKRLKVRDVWGLEDIDPDDSVDLNDPTYITKRPLVSSATTEHIYNLHNQSWGVLRNVATYNATNFTNTSPLIGFKDWQIDQGVSIADRQLPSNADSIHGGMKFNTESTPKNSFYGDEVYDNPPYQIRAPRGSFIIDLLERGEARRDEYNSNIDRLIGASSTGLAPYLSRIGSGALSLDKTPGGASCLAEFAGHIFYSGFSGEVIDGDNQSPKLDSYVFFSQLVKNTRDIVSCYQAGDPTDDTENQIVATDGGFVKIQGAYGIKKLIGIGTGLVILATNGVWLLRGESGIGFTATAYEVIKISDHGCISPESAVVVDNTLFYWGEDGIYQLGQDQFGSFQASNISANTIQSFFNDIGSVDKESCKGIYDSYIHQVRWLYNNTKGNANEPRELVLDVALQAFYPSTVTRVDGTYPFIAAPVEVPPYRVNLTTENVVVGGVQVVAGANGDVTAQSSERVSTPREVKYLTITGETGGALNYTFSIYKDTKFKDWVSFDSTGIDSPAYLLTGYMTTGESMRYKQAPAVVFHFNRTENGFEEVGGDIIPTGQSSCKVQAQWEWANSAASGRWGKEFQAYQYSRHYIPVDVNDDYDYGHKTIVTRRKLRGKGRALSLLIKTEPAKDLQLLGWGMELAINNKG